jgi:hypothetical protein
MNHFSIAQGVAAMTTGVQAGALAFVVSPGGVELGARWLQAGRLRSVSIFPQAA